jgi:organic hydroperoxide reductase OsmC/OhrA
MSTISPTRHDYTSRITWTGNPGHGTSGYTTYGRQYRISVTEKPDLHGSADPAFRGDAHKHSPEDFFIASLSACHMLFFLSLCARGGIQVVAYEDEAQGSIVVDPAGGGRFEEITLRPSVTVACTDTIKRTQQLHETAHELCFIANSCSVPIRIEPVIQVR